MPPKPPAPKRASEAERWFAERIPYTRDELSALDAEARKRAFYVSNVAQVRLVADVQAALQRAIEKGTTLADFKAEVQAKLETEWGGEIPGRIETIFRTNVQSAYNAGRLAQFEEPIVKELRPYRAWSVILDQRTTEFICKPLKGVVVPADSRFAKTHIPPLHFRCRTGIMSLSPEDVEEVGGPTRPPKAPPQEGFGGDPRVLPELDTSGLSTGLKAALDRKLERKAAKPRTPKKPPPAPPPVETFGVKGNFAEAVAQAFPRIARIFGSSLEVECSEPEKDREHLFRQFERLAKYPDYVLAAVAKSTRTLVTDRDLSEERAGKKAPSANAKMGNDRASWRDVEAAYLHAPGVAPTILVRHNFQRVINNYAPGHPIAIAHEVGHAFDFRHEQKLVPYIQEATNPSASHEFHVAWRNFTRSGLPQAAQPYYTGDPKFSPAEVYAEAAQTIAWRGPEAAAKEWTKAVVDLVQSSWDKAE